MRKITKKNIRFLQVGLGSMGKRRIRCLLHFGIQPQQIYGYDPLASSRTQVEKDYGITTFDSFQKAVATAQPDAFLIATPPDKHKEYFMFAARHKKHFFVEPTITDHGYADLLKIVDGSFVVAPSSSWRYLPAIQKIHELVRKNSIGKILSFQYHMGQYLPDWHPWEDYRKVYFAQKKTGACREMFPFELIWLNQLVDSYVHKITGFVEKVSDLDMPADDIYAAVLKYKNGVIGTVSVDVLARKAFRTLRLIGTEGVLDWEWLDYTIKIFHISTKKWKVLNLREGESKKGYVTTEDMYQGEIKAFVEAILQGKRYPYSIMEDWQILRTLFALEESVRKQRTITVST